MGTYTRDLYSGLLTRIHQKQRCKTDKQFEKYFGTSRIVKEHLANEESTLKKEIIAEYPTRAPAKMQEFLLQWQQRADPKCINDMLHVRLRASHLKNFEPVDWKPEVQLAEWRNWGVN